jgi:hypothetical protein
MSLYEAAATPLLRAGLGSVFFLVYIDCESNMVVSFATAPVIAFLRSVAKTLFVARRGFYHVR